MNFFSNSFFNHIPQMHHHHNNSYLFGHDKILIELYARKTMTKDELLKSIGSDEQSLSETLLVLEQKGILKRTPSDNKEKDRISLTSEGRRIAERYKRHSDHLAKHLKLLSEEEKVQFNAVMDQMYSHNLREDFLHFHYRGHHFDFDDDHSDNGGEES